MPKIIYSPLPTIKRLATVKDIHKLNKKLANHVLRKEISYEAARALNMICNTALKAVNAQNIDDRLTTIEEMLKDPKKAKKGGRPRRKAFQPTSVPDPKKAIKKEVKKVKNGVKKGV